MTRVVVAHHLEGPMFADLLGMIDASGEVELVAAPVDRPLELPPRTEVLFTFPVPAWKPLCDGPQPASWPPVGLQWVQLISAGVDMYPAWLLDSLPVVNARGSTAPAIAEYALVAMLTHAKRWDDLRVAGPADWKRRNLGSLAGATVGIAGLGPIGLLAAKFCAALGARVIGWRRSPEPVDGIEMAGSIDELLRQSDHLLLALPLTDATENIIDARALALAKPGMHLINVARGGLVDEAALVAALDEGRLAFATLDTVRQEPPPMGHPFYTHPKVRMTAHVSFSGPGIRERLAAKFLENIRRNKAGEPLLDVVDRARGY